MIARVCAAIVLSFIIDSARRLRASLMVTLDPWVVQHTSA